MDKFEAVYHLVKKWNDSRKSLQICTNDFFHRFKHFSIEEKSFIESLASHQIKHFIYLKFFQEYLDKNKVYPSDFQGKFRELFVLLVHHESLNEAEELLHKHFRQYEASFRDFYLKARFHFKKFEQDIVSRTNYKKQLYVLYSYSRELIDLWTNQFAEDYIISLMKGFNQKPTISIRNNPQKYPRKELRRVLEEHNIFSTPSEFSRKILHVKNRGIYELLHSDFFHDGDFLIIDEGEAVLNQIHKAEEGELILDLNHGNIDFTISFALDAPFRSKIVIPFLNKNDLYSAVKKIKPFKMPHLDLIHVKSHSELLKKYKNGIDTIFVRPRTTQFGRLKVYPDRKWNLQKKYIFKLADRQFQMLEEANELLKPGGYLIYISDTVNLLENEKQINKFLLKYPNYRQVRDFEFDPEFLNKFIQSDNSVFFHPKDIPFGTFYAVKLKKESN